MSDSNNNLSGSVSINNKTFDPVSKPAVSPTPAPPPIPTPAPAPFPSSSWDDDEDSQGGDDLTSSSPWSSSWNSPWDSGANKTNAPKKRLTPQERVTMIEKVYEEVLNRKPDTRDINYYKYSTLEEEEIRIQLLTGKEHKQLLEEGREYKKLKDRAEQSETRVKVLEGQIKDQLEEFANLTQLLKEKNRHIQQLRANLNNPYSFTSAALSAQKEQAFHYSMPNANINEPVYQAPSVVAPQPQPIVSTAESITPMELHSMPPVAMEAKPIPMPEANRFNAPKSLTESDKAPQQAKKNSSFVDKVLSIISTE